MEETVFILTQEPPSTTIKRRGEMFKWVINQVFINSALLALKLFSSWFVFSRVKVSGSKKHWICSFVRDPSSHSLLIPPVLELLLYLSAWLFLSFLAASQPGEGGCLFDWLVLVVFFVLFFLITFNVYHWFDFLKHCPFLQNKSPQLVYHASAFLSCQFFFFFFFDD